MPGTYQLIHIRIPYPRRNYLLTRQTMVIKPFMFALKQQCWKVHLYYFKRGSHYLHCDAVFPGEASTRIVCTSYVIYTILRGKSVPLNTRKRLYQN